MLGKESGSIRSMHSHVVSRTLPRATLTAIAGYCVAIPIDPSYAVASNNRGDAHSHKATSTTLSRLYRGDQAGSQACSSP